MPAAILSEAQLCNAALGRVGHRQLLNDLAEDSTEAALCRAFYPLARDGVLASAWWPFATSRSTLAALTETRTGWTFVYALPAACLAPQYLWAGLRNPPPESRIPYAVELDNAGTKQVLLTDQGSAELVFTRALTTVALFPPLVADAIAWRLAVDLTMSLPVKPQFAAGIEGKAKQMLAQALAVEEAKRQKDLPPKSRTIRVRG